MDRQLVGEKREQQERLSKQTKRRKEDERRFSKRKKEERKRKGGKEGKEQMFGQGGAFGQPRKAYKGEKARKNMVLGFWGNKKKIEVLRQEIQDSFNHVRKDVNKIGDWIKHLDEKKEGHEREIGEMKKVILGLKEEIKETREEMESYVMQKKEGRWRQTQTGQTREQTSKKVQTSVQTSVQTGELERLTVMERAVLWSLLNATMKMSHEDIATLLGKEKSTIRGQVNAIKQKIPGVIEEIQEGNSKKRLYITEENKKKIIKRTKIRINS